MNAATNILFKGILKKTQQVMKTAAKPAAPKPNIAVQQMSAQANKFTPKLRTAEAPVEFKIRSIEIPTYNVRSSNSQAQFTATRGEARLFNNNGPVECFFENGKNFNRDCITTGRNYNVQMSEAADVAMNVAESGLLSH